jgi:hypothetical protein
MVLRSPRGAIRSKTLHPSLSFHSTVAVAAKVGRSDFAANYAKSHLTISPLSDRPGRARFVLKISRTCELFRQIEAAVRFHEYIGQRGD